jgi:hypothetical protein
MQADGRSAGFLDGAAIDDPARPPDRGIDRRTLIKRAAATGVVFWTAPVILDSLASPAAALTCNGACFRVQFPGATDCAGQLSETVVSGRDLGDCTTLTSATCTNTTDVTADHDYSDVCIKPPGECISGDSVEFTLNPSPVCPWQGGGACNAPRRFLAAQAMTDVGSCVEGMVNGTGTAVSFRAVEDSWAFFQFLIACSCS